MNSALPQQPTVKPPIWVGDGIQFTMSDTTTNYLPQGYAEKVINGDGVNGWDWGVRVYAARKLTGKANVCSFTAYLDYAGGEGDGVALCARWEQKINLWASSGFAGWDFAYVAPNVSQHGSITGRESNMFYAANSGDKGVDGVPDHLLVGRFKFTSIHKSISEKVGFAQQIAMTVAEFIGWNVDRDSKGNVTNSGARVRTGRSNDADFVAPEAYNAAIWPPAGEVELPQGASTAALAYADRRLVGWFTNALDLWRAKLTRPVINLNTTDPQQHVIAKDGTRWMPIDLNYESITTHRKFAVQIVDITDRL